MFGTFHIFPTPSGLFLTLYPSIYLEFTTDRWDGMDGRKQKEKSGDFGACMYSMRKKVQVRIMLILDFEYSKNQRWSSEFFFLWRWILKGIETTLNYYTTAPQKLVNYNQFGQLAISN